MSGICSCLCEIYPRKLVKLEKVKCTKSKSICFICYAVVKTVCVVYRILWILFFWVMVDYFNPPAEDDSLFGSVATLDSWNYINREVYVESQKLGIFVDVLIFLLATSNIKNHPKIAKFIFLIPWIQACFNFIEEWLK